MSFKDDLKKKSITKQKLTRCTSLFLRDYSSASCFSYLNDFMINQRSLLLNKATIELHVPVLSCKYEFAYRFLLYLSDEAK